MQQHSAESGVLASGLSYATLGDPDNGGASGQMVIFDSVRVSNAPLEGIRLQGARDAYDDYLSHRQIHIIERRREMPIDYDLDDMVGDYEASVPELAAEPFDLLGISGGGLLALRYAARNPEQVRSLTLLSSGHRLSEPGRKLVRQWADWAEELQWRQIHRSTMQHMFANSLAGALFGGIAFLAPETLGTPEYPWDYVVGQRAIAEGDCSADAEAVRAPTLVITGARDLLFPPEVVEETASRIPRGSASVYPGEAHGLLKSRKRELRDQILSFIEHV